MKNMSRKPVLIFCGLLAAASFDHSYQDKGSECEISDQ